MAAPDLQRAQRLDKLCDVFEAAWLSGQRPKVEDFLRAAPTDERDVLLRELISIDIHQRRKAGERPAGEDYVTRFPELNRKWLADLLGEALPFGEQSTAPPPVPPGLAETIAAPRPIPPKPSKSPKRGSVVQIPGYEILGSLGRGGMGIVYKARQVGLSRIVALKMVRAGQHASADDLARFRQEAASIAQLQHPNIVQIYDFGEHEGQPYFSLEFISGGTLAQRTAGVPQPARDAARLTETLARAVHYAHQSGIVHRDLKPGNILMTVEGVPKITDFGLAKQLESDHGATASGMLLGTPQYMAPEQAAGLGRLAGPPADIYSLGAILYELLTGRPPFQAEDLSDLLQMICKREPSPPRLFKKSIPKDLETICLKCLQKAPYARYASAAALADDLQRYLAGQAIAARPVSLMERGWQWCRQNAVLAGVTSIATALLLTVVALAAMAYSREARLRDDLQAKTNELVTALATRAPATNTPDELPESNPPPPTPSALVKATAANASATKPAAVANGDEFGRFWERVTEQLAVAQQQVTTNPAAAERISETLKMELSAAAESQSERAWVRFIETTRDSLKTLEPRIRSQKIAMLPGQPAAPLAVDAWVQGAPLTDADLKNKVVLLDFFAVWCEPCLGMLPELKRWQTAYADKGLVVISLTRYCNYRWDDAQGQPFEATGDVPPAEEQRMLQKFVQRYGVQHPVAVCQRENTLRDFYAATSLPHLVLIDRAGKVRFVASGTSVANTTQLEGQLKLLLGIVAPDTAGVPLAAKPADPAPEAPKPVEPAPARMPEVPAKPPAKPVAGKPAKPARAPAFRGPVPDVGPRIAGRAGLDKADPLFPVYINLSVANVGCETPKAKVGDTVKITYDVHNGSAIPLEVAPQKDGKHWSGTLQHWIERLAPDSDIPAIPARIARQGRRYAAGGSVIPLGTTIRALHDHKQTQAINTTDYPAGKYRYYIQYKMVNTDVILEESFVDFEIE